MPIQIKILIALLFTALGAITAYELTSHHYNAVIATMKYNQAEADRAAILANDATVHKLSQTVTDLEAHRDQANAAIDHLLNNPTIRVRIPAARVCADMSVIPQAVSSSVPATQPDGATDRSQQILDAATTGLRQRAAEWGKALAACADLQGFVQALP